MLITSSGNPVLKKIRKALSKGSLTEEGLAVAEGPHLLQEAIRSGCHVERVLIVEGGLHNIPEADLVSEQVFREIRATEHSQGVLALVRAPVWKIEDTKAGNLPLVVVLDGVQDPGNAGTIIRSAEAFGATGVVLLKGSVNPWNAKCLRASAGSLFRIPVAYGVSDLSALEGMAWFAATGDAQCTISLVDWTRPTALFIGNEGAGIHPSVLSKCLPIRIETVGVESLNAAVAASVILYEASQRRTRPN
jgi:TrmH family RNA methyltransferase